MFSLCVCFCLDVNAVLSIGLSTKHGFSLLTEKEELVIVTVSRHQVDNIGNFSKNERVKLSSITLQQDIIIDTL